MKFSRISIMASLPLLVVNLIGVTYDIEWLAYSAKLLLYFLLLTGFYKRLDFSNLNITAFLGLSLLSTVLFFFQQKKWLYFLAMFFSMLSYFFLIKEALRYTQRGATNKFMLIFFFLLVAVNIYFLYEHLQQLELYVTGMIEFGFYSVYYINLLVLAIVALVYYLNSYSRKSVFLITLVISLVMADVLRDMAVFYLRDASVHFIESILRFGSLILAFQFFATEEKKLRLINLV